MNKPRKPDLFILVEDLDAIKVWAEQIECALSSLVPEVTTARKGARHLYLTKQYPTCKKLLFMLDTKSDIYRSNIVDTWLKHFSSLKPKDIICVLVDSGATDLTDTELGKRKLNVVKTDNMAHFYNWWPTMVEFLFLKTEAAPHSLNYSLETVHTHEDDQLPRRLTQCLDTFVDHDKAKACSKCQTVKVVGGAGEENPQKRENMHVVITSLGVDQSVYDHCNSVHTRADVLRCVLFILIDSGIVPLRRFSGKELVRQKCKALHQYASHVETKIRDTDPLMFLLSLLVFVMNLPAALLVLCYAFVPLFGFIGSLHLCIKPNNIYFMIAADVFFLPPFVIIGSLALTDLINIHLSTTSIIICFFLLPLAYFVGWVTIVHYVVNKKLDCEYGIWSLPGYLWSTDYKLPECCLWFYLPVFASKLLFLVLFGAIMFITVTFVVLVAFLAITEIMYGYSTKDLIIQTFFNKHILASEPIIIAIILLCLGYPPYIIVPAGVVGCLFFVSVTLLNEWWERFVAWWEHFLA